ncbi:MAG: 30S ribosomal protein S17, partial [Erysipelotrichales bacterium]|nr:30S ribosomal protein S17 [Erysipelotrichales bacterium]
LVIRCLGGSRRRSASVGDVVVIEETRPLSATKRFRLVEVVEKAIVL